MDSPSVRWRLDDMLAFLDVVETGSMTASARRLRLSKSVVSKRIQDLEQALGVELLRRSPRRVVATERGQALYARMRPLLRELDEAAEESAEDGELRGRLRVALPMSLGTLYLARSFARFAAAHPRLELALDLDDRIVDLVGGGYDLAVRVGRLADSSLVARKLCTSRRMVCCSPGYAAEHGVPRLLEELPAHPCIDYANVHGSRLWQFEPARRGGAPRAVAMRGRIVANNGEAMRDAAIEGMGLVLLPDFLAAEPLRTGALVQVLAGEEPLPYAIAAVYPPSRHVPHKVRAVVDHLVAELRHPPPWVRPPGDRSRPSNAASGAARLPGRARRS
jgi:DNA-binding transcriptional LysR family regulator